MIGGDAMSEEKKNEVTEEVKEARELTEENLAQVNSGDNFNVTDWNGYSSQS